MSKTELTLGQAIDAMLAGESVVIGEHRYKICNDQFMFKANNIEENAWMRTDLDSIELRGSKAVCHKFEPTIKWKEVAWHEAAKVLLAFPNEGYVQYANECGDWRTLMPLDLCKVSVLEFSRTKWRVRDFGGSQ